MHASSIDRFVHTQNEAYSYNEAERQVTIYKLRDNYKKTQLVLQLTIFLNSFIGTACHIVALRLT